MTMASPIAFGSLGGTTNPVWAWTTASAFPPTSVTIIASPAAMPSKMTLEKPSAREVRRPKSAAASRLGTSEYCPRNWMRWLIPSAAASASSSALMP